MTKLISFQNLKNYLKNMTNNDKSLLPYQKRANIEFYELLLGKVEDETLGEWIWPDTLTSFTKKNGKCLVKGPFAKLL